jgi:glycerol dehydrogenase-like iron-containing ADH family enzyme
MACPPCGSSHGTSFDKAHYLARKVTLPIIVQIPTTTSNKEPSCVNSAVVNSNNESHEKVFMLDLGYTSAFVFHHRHN